MDQRSDAYGVEVPYGCLVHTTLRNLVAQFVLRDGTDYGEREYSLDEKVAQVICQIESGEARIVFDPESESCDIVRGGASAPGDLNGAPLQNENDERKLNAHGSR